MSGLRASSFRDAGFGWGFGGGFAGVLLGWGALLGLTYMIHSVTTYACCDKIQAHG